MSDWKQSIPSNSPEGRGEQPKQTTASRLASLRVCFFRHSALLAFPESWRETLVEIGETLFDLGIEAYGLAPEETASPPTTRKQVRAIAADLHTTGELLHELAVEPQMSQMTKEEIQLCELASRFLPQVEEISRALDAASREGESK